MITKDEAINALQLVHNYLLQEINKGNVKVSEASTFSEVNLSSSELDCIDTYNLLIRLKNEY